MAARTKTAANKTASKTAAPVKPAPAPELDTQKESFQLDENEVTLTGRLGGDPTTAFTATGKKVSSFRLANHADYRKADGSIAKHVNWFTVKAWGKLADVVEEYLSKGRLVMVKGTIREDMVDSPEGRKYYTSIIAFRIKFLDTPRTNGDEADLSELAEVGSLEILPF